MCPQLEVTISAAFLVFFPGLAMTLPAVYLDFYIKRTKRITELSQGIHSSVLLRGRHLHIQDLKSSMLVSLRGHQLSSPPCQFTGGATAQILVPKHPHFRTPLSPRQIKLVGHLTCPPHCKYR